MTRPIIGITTYAVPVQWSVWETEAALVPISYVEAVERAGGRPLLVPPLEDAVSETVAAVHGLLFSGGEDIDPDHYGADRHPETTHTHPERDRAELALLRAALERDLPVLAVCRGSQVMNVALGGDLVQHLPELVGHEDHRHTPGVFADPDVDSRDGTRLRRIVGERAPVKSHHHQAFGRLGAGLREAARAADGTVEAVEDPQRRFAIGVLWHPEQGEDFALVLELVAEARSYAASLR